MKKSRIARIVLMSFAVLAAADLASPWVAPSLHLAPTQSTAQAKDLEMDAVPALTAEGIRTVQQALQKKGFDPGPIDGIIGPQTEQAVRKFQDGYGISASGRIDNQTLYALGQTQLASEPKP
ncbi:MAG TPA: peptidoglycan-binding domain-containing protein [Xanthobacteraceae bacterium]|jgi:peptidoglycan hydrolase-like protein with peptidoglycan-binding domain